MLISGNIFLAIDSTPSLEVELGSVAEVNDLGKGGITVGYNNLIFQKENTAISLGASYTLLPMKDESEEYGFFSIYCIPNYAFNKKIKGWISFGINIPTYDIDEHENGFSYGLGLDFKVGDKNYIGLGKIQNNTFFEVSGSEFEYTWDRYVLFFGYLL